MLLAIKQAISEFDCNANITINPNAGDYKKRAKLALYQDFFTEGFSSKMVSVLDSMPFINKRFEKFKRRFGLVSEKNITIIFDASGFAYSDQWGPKHSEKWAKTFEKWKKNGKKIVLLPQAFGPFTSNSIKNSIKAIVQNSDLVYVRDDSSISHLIKTVGKAEKIKKAPDFTNLVEGKIPDYFHFDPKRVFIVPNYRMIDKNPDGSSSYMKTIITCVNTLIEKDYNPEFLIHDTKDDLGLAKQLNSCFKKEIPIIQEFDPILIKGMLGNCYAVIGSRFHGLISALSQGVPCLAMGWSHKYDMLFQEYQCPEYLITVNNTEQEIEKKIALLCDEKNRELLKKRLNDSSEFQKEEAIKMWRDIIKVIEQA